MENRRIDNSRSTGLFIFLVVLSVISLASGSRGGAVGNGIKTVVGVAVMPFLTVMNEVGDGFSYVAGIVTEYRELQGSADQMQANYTRMQQDLAELKELTQENERLRGMLAFQRDKTRFELLPAEVIQHSRGVLTIDQGRRHGVAESMCVVTADGVIGLVSQVGPFTSSVITLQNADCRIDAMLDFNRVRGQVHGTGNDLSAICAMHYIDLKEQVRDGDAVVTSPDSVFPSGYPVGWVVGTPVKGQVSQSVNIVPAADPFTVDEVFVLLAADRGAQDVVEITVDQEGFEFVSLMDTQSIQERYAP